jgi:2-isopropylmalate synthase
MSATVEIYDTTLRDGTQREGISLSVHDKLRIAERLDRLGVAFIEGGWPGSNPKDVEFFARARDHRWEHAHLTAFGATRRAGLAVEEDCNLRALLQAGTAHCTVFGKSSNLHVREVLRTTLEENLRMIEESIAFLSAAGRKVIYDAEHFFDGFVADAAYALETLRAAMRGGASLLVLCDTNGGALPWQIHAAVRHTAGALALPLGIHAHNDSGCAVANSLAAVDAGAVQVQGTINGYGERCGNANLCAVIPDLELKMGRHCLPAGALPRLAELARFTAETANLVLDDHMPYVGRSAFSHKGGVHVAAVRRVPASYNHIDPAQVGNRMRVVVSELSGRANVAEKLAELGLPLPETDLGKVVRAIKENEARGYSYEAGEGSVALMAIRQAPEYRPHFRIIDYMVAVQQRHGRGTFAEATVKVAIAGEEVLTAAEGNGPVSALDRALRKALLRVYPGLAAIKLCDYKVRIVDSANGTGAVTRVLIQSSDGERSWGTVGTSQNIIEASCRALEDALEYGLVFHAAAAVQAPVQPEDLAAGVT